MELKIMNEGWENMRKSDLYAVEPNLFRTLFIIFIFTETYLVVVRRITFTSSGIQLHYFFKVLSVLWASFI